MASVRGFCAIPRMNNDRFRELGAGGAIRIAQFENGGAGPVGTLWSP